MASAAVRGARVVARVVREAVAKAAAAVATERAEEVDYSVEELVVMAR